MRCHRGTAWGLSKKPGRGCVQVGSSDQKACSSAFVEKDLERRLKPNSLTSATTRAQPHLYRNVPELLKTRTVRADRSGIARNPSMDIMVIQTTWPVAESAISDSYKRVKRRQQTDLIACHSKISCKAHLWPRPQTTPSDHGTGPSPSGLL